MCCLPGSDASFPMLKPQKQQFQRCGLLASEYWLTQSQAPVAPQNKVSLAVIDVTCCTILADSLAFPGVQR